MKKRWIPFIAIAAMLSISSLATADETEIDFEAYISEDDSAEMVVAAEDEEALFEEDGFIEDLEAADGEVEGVPIDEAHFPDEYFRDYISTNFDTFDDDGKKDGVLSADEIAAVTQMNIFSLYGASNLDGITHFKALTSLYISSCDSLASLDVSGFTMLTTLSLSDCTNLTSFSLSGCTSLTNLNITYCEGLTSLDEIECATLTSLTIINCHNIQSVDLSENTSLVTVDCSNSRIQSLNLRGCTSLTTLILRYSSIVTLNLSGCTSLTNIGSVPGVAVGEATISTLDISNCTALTEVRCAERYESHGRIRTMEAYIDNIIADGCTSLVSLDTYSEESTNSISLKGCNALTKLSCEYNNLTVLDVNDCTALTDLSCSGNKLTSLNVSNCKNLTSLSCEGNNLTSLDVSMCPELKTLHCHALYKKLASLNISNCNYLETCLFNYNSYHRESFWDNTLGEILQDYYLYSNGDTKYELYFDPTAVIITSRGTFPAYSTPETIRNALNPAPAPAAAVSEQITISKKPSNKKPSVSKNKITVNWSHFKQTKKTKAVWKKIKKVQVQCATDKGFSNIVKSTMVGKKKTKAVIKGLAKKTTYYVRVRYFDGTGYSAWSGVKKIKTK